MKTIVKLLLLIILIPANVFATDPYGKDHYESNYSANIMTNSLMWTYVSLEGVKHHEHADFVIFAEIYDKEKHYASGIGGFFNMNAEYASIKIGSKVGIIKDGLIFKPTLRFDIPLDRINLLFEMAETFRPRGNPWYECRVGVSFKIK